MKTNVFITSPLSNPNLKNTSYHLCGVFSGQGVMEEISEERGRNFRYEKYSNRRVFLRSYPLHYHSTWEEEDGEEEQGDEAISSISNSKRKKIVIGKMVDLRLKERFVFVVGWGKGKVLLLKKLKSKVSFYLVSSCHPFGHGAFNPSPSLLSV